MSARELLLTFEIRVAAECESYLAQALLRLHDDARALVWFDSMIDSLRDTYKVAAFKGCEVWNEIEPKL